MIEATKTLDYYEFLQISPHADYETIHRVYRYLAARFHPDNPDTGDPEKFFLLKSAYDVLSDPDRRSEYDRDYEREITPHVPPLSDSVDFMDQVQGELNRRLAVLAVLYYKRRANPYNPQVSLAEIEHRMGFPRDYLDFTTWYLTKKGYVTKADNSDFSLTADGVDFIETQRVNIPVLNKLLTTGNVACTVDVDQDIMRLEGENATPMIVLPDMTRIHERRANSRERRTGAPDWRAEKTERRKGQRRSKE
jgi:curved DNA-binding protein CbpA